MSKSYIFIGNWKMYLTFNQEIKWIQAHSKNLGYTCAQFGSSLILCPSFESLYPIKHELGNTSIALGAQDCSNHTKGAYTGQVSAQSLSEIGCSYCIVGHSERRDYQQETNEIIAQKVEQLILNQITPIVCIGEDKEAYEAGTTEHVLEKQLAPIAQVIKNTAQVDLQLYIAYEPIWSIGTGIIPENSYLENIFAFIKNYVNSWPNNNSTKLLYGGSVNANNCQILKKVRSIEGFLIGSASKDIQELKKIIELTS